MNNGRNGTRRNRNIGTSKQGHGRNNKLVIPLPDYRPQLKFYFEDLKNYRCVKHLIQGYSITFLVEETRKNCVHACTVDDIVRILENVPAADLEDAPMIILRQPKRKEEILNPAWGRYIFFAEIDEHRGSAICIETADLTEPIRWSNSMPPDRQEELERLKSDGHTVETTKRHHLITMNLDTVRSTQLYRTLLHELGHHIDYTRNEEAFETKTSKDKEAFAHHYAEERQKELTEKGIIPFERILNIKRLKADNLRVDDFVQIDENHLPFNL